MAIVYVNTDNTGTKNGTTFATGYDNLQDAIADKAANLTGAGPLVFECGGEAADTLAVSITGYTTTASDYIEIKPYTGYQHAGVWSNTKYRLEAANPSQTLSISEDYVRISGIQIGKSSSDANDQHVITVNLLTSGANDVRISNCLIRGAGGTTYTENGIYTGSANNNLTIWNSVFYRIAIKVAAGSEALRIQNGTVAIYSSTVCGGYRAVRIDAGTLTAKNVYAGGNGAGESWYFAGGTLAKTNCASSDTSADDAGGNESASNCVNSVPHSTSTFSSVTVDSEDYTLVTGSGLIDVGATLSDTPPGSTLLGVDIAGTTRSGTWDIGAFEYAAAAAGLSIPVAMHHYRHNC